MSGSVHSVRRSTIALWIMFFVNGTVLASWAPRIPQVKSELSLTDGQLGWALVGIAAGSVPALFGTARLLERVPARTCCTASAFMFVAVLPAIGVVQNGWWLGVVLSGLGAASGCLDVAMNTAAIRYQNAVERRIFSRLHGGYSLGVLAGAASGALASFVGVTVVEHFVVMSLGLVVLVAASSVFLPTDPVDTAGPTRPTAGPVVDDVTGNNRFARWLVIPVSVGVVAVAALLVEGMVSDWSALVVARDFGGGSTVGAVAVVVFSASMFVSRSIGDLVVERLGSAATVRCSAVVLSAATTAGFVTQSDPWPVVAALGIAGLALGPLFPLAITEAARRTAGGAALATARVSAVGYSAYLGGPPMVGFLADHIGLLTTFVTVACCCGAALLAASMSRSSADMHRT
jgi:MFS family permease